MVVPEPVVRLVPLPAEPQRHTNCFAVVRFVGTVAVHTMLNVLYGEASNTVTVEGWTSTMRPSAVIECSM